MRSGRVLVPIAAMVLALVGHPAMPAQLVVAAPAPSIAVLNVDVWPEHDDPRVLIIYRGQLSGEVPVPHTLTFAVPPAAQVNAAAYRSGDGQLYSVDYQYRQEGGRLLVTLTVPERGFQFEYYADLITGRPQRTFTADLVFPLPVNAMRVAVEQPFRSSALVLDPPAASTTVTPAGFTHHLYTVGSWPAGQVWSVRASYEKADEMPSLPRAAAPPGPPTPASSAIRISSWGWVALVLAVLGVGALVAFWVAQRREGAGPALRPAARADATTRRDRRRPASQAQFCAHCGYRARPGDRFCSRCGRPLRGE